MKITATTALPVLATFVVLCGCALLGTNEPAAQDEIDCVAGGNLHVQIDLNSDGAVDFAIEGVGVTPLAEGVAGGVTFTACSAGDSQIIVEKEQPPGEEDIIALERGELIGEVLGSPYSWTSQPAWVVHYSFGAPDESYGPWAKEGEKYLGLKLVKDGSVYYGWAHVKLNRMLNAKQRLTLESYAYNPEPDQPIRAGYRK